MTRSPAPVPVARSSPPRFDLIVITEPALADPVTLVRAALEGAEDGARVAIQLRAKAWADDERLDAARALREITQSSASALLINGDPALCAAVAADGVQLPEDGPSIASVRAQIGADRWIGVSCHDATRLTHAAEHRADFALLSPWGNVPGKATALGADRFGSLTRAASIAVYALGGIGLREIPQAIAHGAHGVAVIRQLHLAKDPARWLHDALLTIDRARAVTSD